MEIYAYVVRRQAEAGSRARHEASGYYTTPRDVHTYKSYWDAGLDVAKAHVDELRAEGIEANVVAEARAVIY